MKIQSLCKNINIEELKTSEQNDELNLFLFLQNSTRN